MMSQTPKKTPAKGKGRNQPSAKGCSCKRSQCIKNYCDCYQSMMTCTQLCRCVGCRNSEDRMAIEPRTSSRNSNVTKRDPAAAREGFNIPVPLVSNVSRPVTIEPVPPMTIIRPINIIRLAPDTFDVLLQEIPNEQAPQADEDSPAEDAQEQQFPEMEPPHIELVEFQPNLFMTTINEAQQAGRNERDVSRILIAEFTRCFKAVAEEILNM